jgi:hypothetical protein
MVIEDEYISSKSILRHRCRQLAVVPLQHQHACSHLLALRVYVDAILQQRQRNIHV